MKRRKKQRGKKIFTLPEIKAMIRQIQTLRNLVNNAVWTKGETR